MCCTACFWKIFVYLSGGLLAVRSKSNCADHGRGADWRFNLRWKTGRNPDGGRGHHDHVLRGDLWHRDVPHWSHWVAIGEQRKSVSRDGRTYLLDVASTSSSCLCSQLPSSRCGLQLRRCKVRTQPSSLRPEHGRSQHHLLREQVGLDQGHEEIIPR